MLSSISIQLAHWNSPWIDMLGHSDTLSWFRANQFLLFLLNAVWLVEKQQIPISVFGLPSLGIELTIYHTGGKQASHYTTDAVLNFVKGKIVHLISTKIFHSYKYYAFLNPYSLYCYKILSYNTWHLPFY